MANPSSPSVMLTALLLPTMAQTVMRPPSHAAFVSTACLKNGTWISLMSLLVSGISQSVHAMKPASTNCTTSFKLSVAPPVLFCSVSFL